MTEYDYSPAAFQKYMENQGRVSKWVDTQSKHARDYGNPFMPPSDPKEQKANKPTRSNTAPVLSYTSRPTHNRSNTVHHDSRPRGSSAKSRHTSTQSQLTHTQSRRPSIQSKPPSTQPRHPSTRQDVNRSGQKSVRRYRDHHHSSSVGQGYRLSGDPKNDKARRYMVVQSPGRTQASQNAAPRNRQKQQEPTFLKRFFGLIVGSHSSASDRAGRRNSY